MTFETERALIKPDAIIELGNALLVTQVKQLDELLYNIRRLAHDQFNAETEWGFPQHFTEEQKEAWSRRGRMLANIGTLCKEIVNTKSAQINTCLKVAETGRRSMYD